MKSSGVQKSQSGTLEPTGTSTQLTGFASPLLSGLRALAALKQVWLHVHLSNTLTVIPKNIIIKSNVFLKNAQFKVVGHQVIQKLF